MAVVDSAYQYYLSTYAKSTVSRYDTHKKSQLRDIYNQMVKINKESPLYKIKNVGDVTKYAIDIKESSKQLQNVISSLSDSNGTAIEDVFSKRIACSSDENVATAEYIGSADADDIPSDIEIQVAQLASNQVNQGNYLNPERLDIEPGIYSFDLNTAAHSYEFQYTVAESDTNDTILRKLSKLVNGAGIGISATIDTNEAGQVALNIASKQTGVAENATSLFEVLPATDAGSMNAMNTLGIQQITTEAQNSLFLLNGNPHSSYSNNFTVDNHFDITLHAPNESLEPIKIGFKANTDAIADNLQKLVDAYNNMIDIGYSHDGSASSKLVRDLSSVTRSYHNELEAIGINMDSNSRISIDRNLLADAVTASDAKDAFQTLNDFKDSLQVKTNAASIDPMNYVNKVVVAYKNPGKNFVAPYITSIYSGMMLDQYC